MGPPLTIYGSAQVDVKLNGKDLSTNVVVVSPLTVEAILDIDFLKKYSALIDLVNESLHLAGEGGTICLQEPPGSSLSDQSKVCIVSKVEIPSYSEMEVLACQSEQVMQGRVAVGGIK